MLVEDFNSDNIIIDYIISECKRLKCMGSLNSFILGNTKHFKQKANTSHGTHNVKTIVKPKTSPFLIFKECDMKLKSKASPLLSKGTSIQQGRPDNESCIAFLPDNCTVGVVGNLEVSIKKKSEVLVRRLTQHLKKKTDMDTFEVGECISKVNVYSANSISGQCKNFSEAYSKIVEAYPNQHKVIANHYLKPLKEYMDDYIEQCPTGSIELFENYEEATVACKEIPFVCLDHMDLTIDEFRDKLKKRMNGYA